MRGYKFILEIYNTTHYYHLHNRVIFLKLIVTKMVNYALELLVGLSVISF